VRDLLVSSGEVGCISGKGNLDLTDTGATGGEGLGVDGGRGSEKCLMGVLSEGLLLGAPNSLLFFLARTIIPNSVCPLKTENSQ